MESLPSNFYVYPKKATAVMDRKDLKELLLKTEGFCIALGRSWDIVSKPLGAGVYKVSLKRKFCD